MSSAGRAANSNGCVSKPKEHATGLIGFAAQIRRSSLIGSCAMETAEHREPCELRGSRTDLGAPGGPQCNARLLNRYVYRRRHIFRAAGFDRAYRQMGKTCGSRSLLLIPIKIVAAKAKWS